MYQSGSTQSAPRALLMGVEIGTTQNSRALQSSGSPAMTVRGQPATTMTVTTTAPRSHAGGSSRMLRFFSTRHGLPGERSRELAIRDPARANMMPTDGNRIGSHAHPKKWEGPILLKRKGGRGA